MRALHSLLLASSLALVLVGCGGSDGGSSGKPRSADTAATAPAAGSPEAVEEKAGVNAEVAMPDADACLEEAGFAPDAPPTAALRAWRGPDGARAVLASDASASVTGGIAAEIEGGRFDALVEGAVVVAGPDAPARAALDCLT